MADDTNLSVWSVIAAESAVETGARPLDEAEIERLLGLEAPPARFDPRSGVGAIVAAGVAPSWRLPMLQLAFDRLARALATSMRSFTGDNAQIELETIGQGRFGERLALVMPPAVLGVTRIAELDGRGLVVVHPDLLFAVLDITLGGRRVDRPARPDERATTAIERSLVQRLVEIVLEEMGRAFAPLTPLTFELERLETLARLAAIERPANPAVVAKLRIDMEDRGGRLEIILPLSTLEPILSLLGQEFAGEAPAADDAWGGRLAGGLRSASLEVRAVLGERRAPLSSLLKLKVGDTLVLDARPGAPVQLKAGATPLALGRLGRRNGRMAVRLEAPVTAAALRDKKGSSR
jgi:flagellar motor switch protein FliM